MVFFLSLSLSLLYLSLSLSSTVTHLCGVHYEGGLLDVGTDSQEGKEPNTTLERSLPVHETGNSIVKNKLNIAF